MVRFSLFFLCTFSLYPAAYEMIRQRSQDKVEHDRNITIKQICSIDQTAAIKPMLRLFETKSQKDGKLPWTKKSIVQPALIAAWISFEKAQDDNKLQNNLQAQVIEQLYQVLKADQLKHGVKDKYLIDLLKNYTLADGIQVKNSDVALQYIHLVILTGDLLFEGYKGFTDGVVHAQWVRGPCAIDTLANTNQEFFAIPPEKRERKAIVRINLKAWQSYVRQQA